MLKTSIICICKTLFMRNSSKFIVIFKLGVWVRCFYISSQLILARSLVHRLRLHVQVWGLLCLVDLDMPELTRTMARPAVSDSSGVQVVFVIVGFKVILDVLVFLDELDTAFLVVDSGEGAYLLFTGAAQVSSLCKWLILWVTEPLACRADGFLVLVILILFRCLVLLLLGPILGAFGTRNLNVEVLDFWIRLLLVWWSFLLVERLQRWRRFLLLDILADLITSAGLVGVTVSLACLFAHSLTCALAGSVAL